jgi:hypothetical protein
LKNRAKVAECSEFNIQFANENIDNRLFFKNLKNSLDDKLTLITSKNSDATKPIQCKLLIDMGVADLPSIIGDSGNASVENQRIAVKYELETDSRKILRSLELFYSKNTSVFRYSNYMKNKKESYNLLENIAEDIFMDILKQLR